MSKSFKTKNPNAMLAGETNTSTKEEKTVKIEPSSLDTADSERERQQKKQKYLRLNITDYQDYVSLMAEHFTNKNGKYMSMTQYILRLIEADKQENLEIYEKLVKIENMKREIR